MTSQAISKVVLAGVLIAGCLSLVRFAPAADTPRKVEIVAKRFTYTPDEITLKKGEPVVLVFRSEDVTHGLKFKEFDLQVEAGKGDTKEVSFTPTQAGDFVGHCSHFCGAGHGSMALTLHVTE